MSNQPAAKAPAAPAGPAPTAGTGVAFATMTAAGEVPTLPAPPPTQTERTAKLIESARATERTERLAAAGIAAPPAPAAAATPPAPAPGTTDAKPPGTDPPKVDPNKPAKADTVTERIADLTRRNRELTAAREQAEAARVAAETKAANVEAALAEAKKGGNQLDAIKAAFKSDPLAALEQLGEKWADIVVRVANGGLPPTPEQVAAAERERVEAAREARIKALEEEKAADKKEREAREATERAQRAEQEAAGARKYVSEKLIDPAKHPHLVNIADDAAAEALAEVDLALEEAFKAKKRSSPNPVDVNESIKLTTLALDGLESYYRDLRGKLAPKDPQQSGSQGAGAPATQVAPAAVAAPAVAAVVAESQQRGPITTTTNAVAGEMPTATQPKRSTADDARARAMAAARSLPPL